jgi:GTPase SAR1 family protein
VIGQAGSGKTSLIGQFVSSSASSYADSDENGQPDQPNDDCTVSVNIGGHECDLHFFEHDLAPFDQQQEELPPSIRVMLNDHFHAFLLVYSIDRKQSFRVALQILEQLRRANNLPNPIILVGNKADLERKRAVMESDVRSVMLTYDVPHFEVSVALNHDVDGENGEGIKIFLILEFLQICSLALLLK